MGGGHVTQRDTERVHDETSGISPGPSRRRDGVRTGHGTSHNICSWLECNCSASKGAGKAQIGSLPVPGLGDIKPCRKPQAIHRYSMKYYETRVRAIHDVRKVENSMSTSPKPAVKLLNEVLHEMWGMEMPEIQQEILADLEGWGASEREHAVEEKVKMTGELENWTAEDYQRCALCYCEVT